MREGVAERESVAGDMFAVRWPILCVSGFEADGCCWNRLVV